jgi:HEPN domain-containing protein
MKRTTAEWIRKAEDDYQLAVKLGREKTPFRDQLCFHCQQAAQKYLKALLEEQGLPVPHTHILRDLLALLIPSYSALRPLQRGSKFLTRFAVGTRYPGQKATKRQTQAALRWAERVRTPCRSLLGIKPKRRRKK